MYFPVFGLNTEINFVFGHFPRSDNHKKKFYVKFDNNISKTVTKKKNEIPGMIKEIVPITIKKVTFFSEDLVPSFL